jgi:hypothetical protein
MSRHIEELTFELQHIVSLPDRPTPFVVNVEGDIPAALVIIIESYGGKVVEHGERDDWRDALASVTVTMGQARALLGRLR